MEHPETRGYILICHEFPYQFHLTCHITNQCLSGFFSQITSNLFQIGPFDIILHARAILGECHSNFTPRQLMLRLAPNLRLIVSFLIDLGLAL